MLSESAPAMVLAAVLGLAVGSFLNVLVHRLPRMLERAWQVQACELRGEPVSEAEVYSLWRPASHCPSCATPLRWRDNVPVVSYLLLRGACAHCAARIGMRYPLIEILTASLFVVAVAFWGTGWQAIAAMGLLACLVALAFIDLDTQLLPDMLTLPLLWLGLFVNLFGLFAPLADAVVGAMAGYLSLWSVYWLFKLATGKEGMGHGDFKLLAAIGAWLGWQVLPATIFLAAVVGALVGLARIVLGRAAREQPIPFGPFLSAAGVIAAFWGGPLTRYYLR